MASTAFSYFGEGPFRSAEVHGAAVAMRKHLGAPASVAFAFVSADYLEHLDEFIDTVRVDGHVGNVIGCTGNGLLAGAHEHEGASGFALLGLHSPGTHVTFVDLQADRLENAQGNAQWRTPERERVESWIALTNPFAMATDDWLTEWGQSFVGVPVIGGLASGGTDEAAVAVFHNSRVVNGGVAVGFNGPLKIIPAVSQGCRPIGEALPVTRAEDNIVFALGSRPAYQALETAFQSLTEAERSKAQGNLFAGLANNEYVDEFRSGDFLIRNILGADPNSGAVVIGGTPRVGQTLQYQLRDSQAAHEDLQRVLAAVPARGKTPIASLVFTCLGRGTGFFTEPNHDAALIQSVLQPHDSIGFSGNGEIGPVGGRSCVHGYTASCALFFDQRL